MYEGCDFGWSLLHFNSPGSSGVGHALELRLPPGKGASSLYPQSFHWHEVTPAGELYFPSGGLPLGRGLAHNAERRTRQVLIAFPWRLLLVVEDEDDVLERCTARPRYSELYECSGKR